jgi:hypothetical protein
MLSAVLAWNLLMLSQLACVRAQVRCHVLMQPSAAIPLLCKKPRTKMTQELEAAREQGSYTDLFCATCMQGTAGGLSLTQGSGGLVPGAGTAVDAAPAPEPALEPLAAVLLSPPDSVPVLPAPPITQVGA